MVGTPLKTKWLFVRRGALSLLKHRVPRQLWIGITYKCQCHCIHCFLGPQLNKGTNELNRDKIYSLIERAKHLGFMEICFFGGEPLLHEGLLDFIRFSSRRGLLTTIFTNGILLTHKKVRELKESGLYQCNVSVDSASPERHDDLRGYAGCFEKTVEGIRHLSDAGVKSSIWTYVKKEDVNENDLADLKGIIEMGRRLKVHKVVVLYPCASGNWIQSRKNMLTGKEREKVRDVVRELDVAFFVDLEFPDEGTPCNAGRTLAYISPHGDLSPCPVVPYFVGNIHRESFETILNKLDRKFLEEKPKGCGECLMNIDFFRDKIGVDKLDTH